jgi:hypothetical protein
MADYRALAQALDPFAVDSGAITPDSFKALQNIRSPNLLGMISEIGRGGLSNLESLVRGGVAQFAGTPVDTLNTIRTPYPMEVMGDVNYAPDKQVYGGTKDILGMLPKRVTQARPETAGMEELGTIMGPGLAKAAAPAAKGYLSLLGNEINAGLTGQPTRSVVGQMTPKPLQIFIGENSKSWNKEAAKTAIEMEKAGAKPEDIWSATGTFRGAEGKLRQEISDVSAQLLNKQKNFEGKLHETLSHPELYKNYPALQYYDTDITSEIALPEHMKKTLIGRGGGSFTEKDFVSGEPKITAKAYSEEDKKALLHELQHAVQAKEGFARGGSPGSGNDAPFVYGVGEASQKLKQIESLLEKTPYNSPEFDNLINQQANLTKQAEAEAAYEGYRRLAGEVEARATEARMNLTDKERRAKFPYESYDVPKSNLIVRKP